MTVSPKPAPRTPTSTGGSKPSSADQQQTSRSRGQFVTLALNMSWQLAIVVLVPVFVGVQLDKHFGTSYAWTFVGLAIALIGSGAVMWRAMQTANRLPVPKLTEEQRREVRKRYEEEDKD